MFHFEIDVMSESIFKRTQESHLTLVHFAAIPYTTHTHFMLILVENLQSQVVKFVLHSTASVLK